MIQTNIKLWILLLLSSSKPLRLKKSRKRRCWTLSSLVPPGSVLAVLNGSCFHLDSLESIGCQMQQPPHSSSFRSVLMSSAVQRPLANQGLEDNGQKKKEEQTLLLLFSPPTSTPRPAGCDPSPLTLTHDSWSRSHATPLCVHLAMATPWSPLLLPR